MRDLLAVFQPGFAALVSVALIVGVACGGGDDGPGDLGSGADRTAGTPGESVELDGPEAAEQDDSASLPGEYFPPLGRSHFSHRFSRDREPYPFCPGVPHAGDPGAQATGRPAGASTDCYNSNPPASGIHLGVDRNVDLGAGAILPRIPPDPNVYPAQVAIPREAVPHILEHAGVFVGYNCAGDASCEAVVSELEALVHDRLDDHNDRVVMGYFPDLPPGEIGIAAWTRVLRFEYGDYDGQAAEEFITIHACRFDPEGFCS